MMLIHRSLKNPIWRMMLDEDVLWAKKNADEKKACKQVLRRLQTRGLIEIYKIGKGIQLDFTDRARHLVLISKIKQNNILLPGGKVCVVCMDIPEQAKKARRAMNEILKVARFKRIQKSVWEGRANIIAELDELIGQHRAKSWVSVYLAENPRNRIGRASPNGRSAVK